MSEEVIMEDDIWVRGIKLQKKLLKAMNQRFLDLGMSPVNRTECIRYCINSWIQATAKDVHVFRAE